MSVKAKRMSVIRTIIKEATNHNILVNFARLTKKTALTDRETLLKFEENGKFSVIYIRFKPKSDKIENCFLYYTQDIRLGKKAEEICNKVKNILEVS